MRNGRTLLETAACQRRMDSQNIGTVTIYWEKGLSFVDGEQNLAGESAWDVTDWE
jgi:hypothetical protein